MLPRRKTKIPASWSVGPSIRQQCMGGSGRRPFNAAINDTGAPGKPYTQKPR